MVGKMETTAWLFKCKLCGGPLLVTRGALGFNIPMVPPIEARVEEIKAACPICGRPGSYPLLGISLKDSEVRVKVGEFLQWALFHQHWNFVYKARFGGLIVEDVVPYQSLPDFRNEMLRTHFEFKSSGFGWADTESDRMHPGKVFVNRYSLDRKVEQTRANPGEECFLVKFFHDVGYRGCRFLDLVQYRTVEGFEGRGVRGSGEPAALVPLSEFRPLDELIEARARELGL